MTKNKHIYSYLIISLLILSTFVFGGCVQKSIKLVNNNLAEIRYNIYSGELSNVYATFMSGKREKDYCINGVATPLVPFGIITITMEKENIATSDTATYSLLVGNKEYTGTLEINPFDGTYVADIQELIDNDNLTLTFSVGSFNTIFELTKQNTDWKVDCSEAIKIACKNMDKDITKLTTKNKLKAECYVKIIYNHGVENKFYWYVRLCSTNGTSKAILIDPYSKEVLSQK